MERDTNGTKALPHSLTLQDRKKLTLSGVNDVAHFDENQITVMTELGALLIRGSELHVDQLNLERGELRLTGEIDQLEYEDNPAQGGFFRRLFQ